MRSLAFGPSVAWLAVLCSQVVAQQYAGATINNSLPTVAGAELAFYRTAAGSTLLNYYSHTSTGQRINEAKIERAVICFHGSLRNAWDYETDMLSALGSGAAFANVNNTAIMAVEFPNEEDKGRAYQQGDSTLVYSGYQWFYGANNIAPSNALGQSSFAVIDELVQYFDNKTLFPNVKTIVITGHSRGAQLVDRYAKLTTLTASAQRIYYVGNPNGYLWLKPTRPVSTSSCPTYDNYPDGLSNFTQTPMTYGAALVAKGRAAVMSNYNSKIIAYARGLRDMGDASDTCAPYTQGSNRYTRFFNWIKSDVPSCTNPAVGPCDTIDYVNAGHNDLEMFSSNAGRARLFTDNFLGHDKRAYDFYYPRIQQGDDPYPNPNRMRK